MGKEKVIELYIERFGTLPEKIEKINGSGSNREYFRIKGVPEVIGVEGKSKKENSVFLTLSRHFKEKNLPVPEILAVSEDGMTYLQEDLGKISLFDAIKNGRATGNFSAHEISLLTKTIEQLADLQYRGAQGLDFTICYPVESFDRRSVMWDFNYFKYCFIKNCGIEPDEVGLENEFERLADELLATPSDTFMYRDFQSRNVMIKDNYPYFIDYQGGRRGPAEYDVASFLWQAKANIPDYLKEKLIIDYYQSASKYRTIDFDNFSKRLKLFALFRTLQVLGAYGYRGLFEGKAHFVESIPNAARNFRDLISQKQFDSYSTLRNLSKRISEIFSLPEKRDSLLVTVMSFSYKKGLPTDRTGNGGGYIFDCRGMHNPGRYEEYKQITGKDRPVIDFLEERGEVQKFLSNCYGLVDNSVDTYLRRGFTHLFVGFGCTGGQHRSVYCAEKMAEHLREKYSVEINLIHREQN